MLQVEALEARYGAVRALKGISLSVSEGEIVTLIGANGAGKSTTLKAISGLVPASAGRIEFEGEVITGLPPHRILARGIAHIPEGRRIFPDLTVLENLRLGGYLIRDKAQFRRGLERVFDSFPILAERRQQLAGTLSGGEQQMLAVGRGLMSNPKLLLLDEPSLGLSPRIVTRVAQIIQDIHKQGVTILLVEQKAQLALGIAGRGYVLETGRIVLEDAAANLVRNALVKRAYLGL
ncbi:MAG: ABC transporter ATP-binding protein [Deltaproteobacteria bacterium]|nr:ABC transporter ATP-binding protein [Deltaproteobacteria bacterium]